MSRSTAIVPRADNAIYMAASGELQLDVRIDSETVWLTQAQIAELFGVDVRTINEHLVNVYRASELEREATIRNFRIVRRTVPQYRALFRSMPSSLGRGCCLLHEAYCECDDHLLVLGIAFRN